MSGSQRFVPLIGRVVAAAGLAIAMSSAPGTAMSVKIVTPVVCSADVSFNVVRFSPLLIDARVHQKCNTLHQLTVTYQPENLSNPRLLQIRFGGEAPDINDPGSASFTDLPYTDSVSHVRISYVGPRDERQQLIETVRIGVSY